MNERANRARRRSREFPFVSYRHHLVDAVKGAFLAVAVVALITTVLLDRYRGRLVWRETTVQRSIRFAFGGGCVLAGFALIFTNASRRRQVDEGGVEDR